MNARARTFVMVSFAAANVCAAAGPRQANLNAIVVHHQRPAIDCSAEWLPSLYTVAALETNNGARAYATRRGQPCAN